ncbi:MAG: hypothetical protein A2X86_12765 [Bdellovibrionales bacterium GWA2_49_15]|nr:MAG: hypothetical protein A2X86_12765 [Bdellovibrionales bacterium GWA2_49_15]HAZ14725.1 hypothetical protein [Bdellovibrionales bacterium]
MNFASKKKKILVIDDNIDHLLLDKTILEAGDYEVFTAQNGQEGLATLSRITLPDLILLDVRMNDMSGPEFLSVLEKSKPEILEKVPVVFLTASETAPPSRAVGFIRKPMEINNFLLEVKRFIETGSS